MSSLKGAVIGIGVLLAVAAISFGALFWQKNLRVSSIDSKTSPDGEYSIVLSSVGEPVFPFGPAGGMLVLFHEGESVAAQKILIRDDGARISPDSWSVEWEDGGCRVTVRGSEMDDEEYYFPFR